MGYPRVFLALAAAVASVGCDSLPVLGGRDVTYRVTGSAQTVTLNFRVDDSMCYAFRQTLPWSYGFPARRGDYVRLFACIEGDTGSVTVAILIDGSAWRGATTYGGHIGTNAEGLIP